MAKRAHILTVALVAALAVLGTTASARAQGLKPEAPVPMPPDVVEGVGVTEHLAAEVPKDAAFVDQTGKPVVLGDYLRDDVPVLLTFNYSNCPQLCDLQLNNLVKAIAASKLTPGRQYRIVTIIMAPGEAPARTARTRDRYVGKLDELGKHVGDVGGVSGWTFLLSRDGKDERSIRAVADAVGFGYRYIPRQNEYAHPATLIALSARGMVTRYLHGIEPVASDLDFTIGKAGLAEPTASSGFLLTCLHWDPHGKAAMGARVMRFGALGFASIVILALVIAIVRRRARNLPGVPPS